MKNLLKKENLLTAILLLFLIVILNGLVFSNQLNYGFRDVDWQVLYYFKSFGKLSLNHLIPEIKVLGVYIPESYYVGLLEKWIGLNFSQLHLFTHLLKVISAISLYVLILRVFKRKRLAFLTSLIYTVSYTHAGVLFQLSSGGYFLAIIFMNLFLMTYYNCFVDKRKRWLIISSVLLPMTLILKPERMYPLILFLIIIELFMLFSGRFRKGRLAIFIPLIIMYPFYSLLFTKGVPAGFAPGQFAVGLGIKVKSILNGNPHLLSEPFASLGSIFLYGDYRKLLGQLNFSSLTAYLLSLVFGPVSRLGLVTFVIFSSVNGKVLRPVLFTLLAMLAFGMALYALNINWQNIPPSLRIHFDTDLIAIPAMFGFYFFFLAILFLWRYLKSSNQNLIIPIIGITFASLFILMTWASSDIQLIFMGPQRYLSIPSIGVSLFMAWVILTIYEGLKKGKARQFAWVIFLLLGLIIFVNYNVANNFFNDELNFAGVRATDQNRMKDDFRSLLGEINTQDRSLFYFDETQDTDNAYFDEGAVLAGFEYWLKFNKDGTLNNMPTPGMMRSTRQCPEHTHLNCIKVLAKGLGMENGEKGIWYQDPLRGNVPFFYKLNNFHAYRFDNKKIIDIRQEVLRELGL